MMDLNSNLLWATTQFLKTIPLDKREKAFEALDLLDGLGIYPISDPNACVGDLQSVEDKHYPTDSSLRDKLVFIAMELENENEKLCMAVLFLIKFYFFIYSACPEFKIPVGTLNADNAEEYTKGLSAVCIVMNNSQIEDIFKDFINLSFKQHFNSQKKQEISVLSKKVTELKDQIVCAQMENDDRVWDNMRSVPLDQEEGCEEIYD